VCIKLPKENIASVFKVTLFKGWTYEGESVNRSQMDIKPKTYDIKKTFISRRIFHQHWYTCPKALAVRRNPQHRSLLTVVSATSATPFQPLRHQRNVCDPAVNRSTRRTLPTVNRKHSFMNILCIESSCPQKTNAKQNAASRLYSPQVRSPIWLLKPASEHAYAPLLPRLSWSWSVLLPRDIYIENLLRSLQLFHFHLWPVYWLSVVVSSWEKLVPTYQATRYNNSQQHNMNLQLGGSLERELACSLMDRRNSRRQDLRSSNVNDSFVSVFVRFSTSSKHSHEFGKLCSHLRHLQLDLDLPKLLRRFIFLLLKAVD
jgi:hypothetical protein